MEVRPLVAAVLFCFAALSASERVEPCQSGENCPEDHCCVVLPWIPSNKGGICAKHTQRGEVCWPPHHDYKKYLFYCPCGKELKCKPLHAFEEEQNMTFHLDVCVPDNGENEGQETENPDNVENPEESPAKEESDGDDNSEKDGDDNSAKEESYEDDYPENEDDKEEDKKQEEEPKDENEEPKEENDDYSDEEANPDDDDNSDDEKDDEDYSEPTEEYKNEAHDDYNEPNEEYRKEEY